MNKQPLVNVFMMAYNHEKYIGQALDGILMQKTNFDYEIVVGEDCSTDKTRQIILDYSEKYPDNYFKLILHEKNIGANANQMAVFQACTGKYIALCEGDDFWTDSLKLQRQVDFLEANEEYSACAHRVSINYDDPFDREIFFYNDDINDFETLLQHFYPTCSLVFRRSCLDEDAIRLLTSTHIMGGDKLLLMILFKHGKLKFIHQKMATYRKHKGGVSYTVGLDKIYSDSIRFYKAVNKYFEKKYAYLIRKNILINYGNLAVSYKRKKRIMPAIGKMIMAFIHVRSFTDVKIFIRDVLIK